MIRALAALQLLACACGAAPPPVSASASASASVSGSVSDSVSDSASDSASAPLRVAVISDLNSEYGSTEYVDAVHAAIRRIVELDPDLVISTGDMVAGQRPGLDYAAMWAAFHRTVTDPLGRAGIPFAVTPGNHDASEYPRFERERATYIAEWSPRRPDLAFVDGSEWPLRYGFVIGPALFIALDVTGPGTLSDGSRAWLQATLEAHADTPVKIVFSHLPIHPFTIGREREVVDDAALEELLRAHRVTAMLSGHHHGFYPGWRDGIRYVGCAALGTGQRELIGTEEESPRSFVWIEIDATGIRQLDAYGGPRFDQVIDRATLPPAVGALVRDDLRRGSLPPDGGRFAPGQ